VRLAGGQEAEHPGMVPAPLEGPRGQPAPRTRASAAPATRYGPNGSVTSRRRCRTISAGTRGRQFRSESTSTDSGIAAYRRRATFSPTPDETKKNGLGTMTMERWEQLVKQLTDLGVVEASKAPAAMNCFVQPEKP